MSQVLQSFLKNYNFEEVATSLARQTALSFFPNLSADQVQGLTSVTQGVCQILALRSKGGDRLGDKPDLKLESKNDRNDAKATGSHAPSTSMSSMLPGGVPPYLPPPPSLLPQTCVPAYPSLESPLLTSATKPSFFPLSTSAPSSPPDAASSFPSLLPISSPISSTPPTSAPAAPSTFVSHLSKSACNICW